MNTDDSEKQSKSKKKGSRRQATTMSLMDFLDQPPASQSAPPAAPWASRSTSSAYPERSDTRRSPVIKAPRSTEAASSTGSSAQAKPLLPFLKAEVPKTRKGMTVSLADFLGQSVTDQSLSSRPLPDVTQASSSASDQEEDDDVGSSSLFRPTRVLSSFSRQTSDRDHFDSGEYVLVKSILSWTLPQLQPDQPLWNVKKTLKVPNKFTSQSHYSQIFKPLIVEEARATIASGLEKAMQGKVRSCKLTITKEPRFSGNLGNPHSMHVFGRLPDDIDYGKGNRIILFLIDVDGGKKAGVIAVASEEREQIGLIKAATASKEKGDARITIKFSKVSGIVSLNKKGGFTIKEAETDVSEEGSSDESEFDSEVYSNLRASIESDDCYFNATGSRVDGLDSLFLFQEKLMRDDKITAYVLGSVISCVRMYDACRKLPRIAFESNLLRGEETPEISNDDLAVMNLQQRLLKRRLLASAATRENRAIQGSAEATLEKGSTPAITHCSSYHRLNHSQQVAVDTYEKLVQENKKQIMILQGPPGTGKTTTLTTLLEELVRHGKRVLVCAPSNKAIQVLASRFLQACPDIPMMLAGVETKLPDELKVVFLHLWGVDVVREAADLHYALTHLLFVNFMSYQQTRAAFEKYSGRLFSAINALTSSINLQLDYFKGEIQAIVKGIEMYKSLFTSMTENSWRKYQAQPKDQLEKNPLKAQFEKIVLAIRNKLQAIQVGLDDFARQRQLETMLLNKAQVIFTTLCVAGRKSICEMEKVDDLVVEEGGQATESEARIPLVHKPDRMLIVGDQKQLSATVTSPYAEAKGFGRSLMERMSEELKFPSLMLRTQYRMEPCFRQKPSKMYYGGCLEDGDNIAVRENPLKKLNHLPFFPYAFFDIKGQERRVGHSFSNPAEVKEIKEFLWTLLGHFSVDNMPNIGIISFYAEQIALLKSELSTFPAIHRVSIHTVDGFQGGEREVIIISSVRANEEGNVGFVRDQRRLNVAMTRAKYGLFAFGDCQTLLKSQSDFRSFVEDAQERGCVFSSEVLSQFNYSSKQPVSEAPSSSIASHPSQASRKGKGPQAKKPCHFFASGSCHKGNACSFSHLKPPL